MFDSVKHTSLVYVGVNYKSKSFLVHGPQDKGFSKLFPKFSCLQKMILGVPDESYKLFCESNFANRIANQIGYWIKAYLHVQLFIKLVHFLKTRKLFLKTHKLNANLDSMQMSLWAKRYTEIPHPS